MSTSTPGRSPNVSREERIELYNKLADILDQAKETAMALKLPQWRKRINQYTRQAYQAREERDNLLDVIARLEMASKRPHPRKSRPDTPAENKRRERDAARKRQERRERSERTADAMMLPGGVNSLAWKLLHGDPSERSED